MPVQMRDDFRRIDLRLAVSRSAVSVPQDIAAQRRLHVGHQQSRGDPFPLISASAMAMRVGEMRMKS